jgi:hypothetical protein
MMSLMPRRFVRRHAAKPCGLSPRRVPRLFEIVGDEADARIPSKTRLAVSLLLAQIEDLQGRIKDLEHALIACSRRRDEPTTGDYSWSWCHHRHRNSAADRSITV